MLTARGNLISGGSTRINTTRCHGHPKGRRPCCAGLCRFAVGFLKAVPPAVEVDQGGARDKHGGCTAGDTCYRAGAEAA
jgi:hypothetical protein